MKGKKKLSRKTFPRNYIPFKKFHSFFSGDRKSVFSTTLQNTFISHSFAAICENLLTHAESSSMNRIESVSHNDGKAAALLCSNMSRLFFSFSLHSTWNSFINPRQLTRMCEKFPFDLDSKEKKVHTMWSVVITQTFVSTTFIECQMCFVNDNENVFGKKKSFFNSTQSWTFFSLTSSRRYWSP